jgi:hypothetical protein
VTIDGKKVPPEVIVNTREEDTGGPAGKKAAPDQEAGKKALTAAELAFRENAAWLVGGTWHGTDQDGAKVEVRADWVLGGQFARFTGKVGDGYVELHGIDQATGRWTY